MKRPYKAGEYLVHCDQCARQFYASEVQKRWDGLMVCKDDYESRHSQDFVRAVPDSPPLPFVRKNAADIDLASTVISAVTGAAYSTIPSGTFTIEL